MARHSRDNLFSRIQISLVASAASVFLNIGSVAQADLDEDHFVAYSPGLLHGQRGWSAQGTEDGRAVVASERVEVKSGEDGERGLVEFVAGFDGPRQTRIVKSFPSTTGGKAVATLGFRPGAPSVGGRLYFDQATGGTGAALQFVGDTVWVLEYGKEGATNTGIAFYPERINQFEIRFDFEAHTYEVLLAGSSIGTFEMSPTVRYLDRVNFYGGGLTFSSTLDQLSVLSVDQFADQEQ